MKSDLIAEIRLAIGRENEAYALYQDLSRKSHGMNLQALFNTLAVEELKHEALLKECLRSGDIRAALRRITERYDDFTLSGRMNPSVDFSGVHDGMELAMRLEAKAMENYLKLEAEAEDLVVKDAFHFLSLQERSHLQAIKREFDRF